VIVVGVDGSESSKDALRWAGRQADLTGAALHVVAAWQFPIDWGWLMTNVESFDPKGQTLRALQATVDDVLGSDADVRLLVVEDKPASALVNAAKEAELLVVGSRGRGQSPDRIIGSVSEHCFHQATCPVVVVRHQ
jgi:nucleotide-binding universal stress UspA family protein